VQHDFQKLPNDLKTLVEKIEQAAVQAQGHRETNA
jgi:hypothetical protein